MLKPDCQETGVYNQNHDYSWSSKEFRKSNTYIGQCAW